MSKNEKTPFDPELAKKALLVIEEMAASADVYTESKVLVGISKFAHVGRGGCISHENWRDEMLKIYDMIEHPRHIPQHPTQVDALRYYMAEWGYNQTQMAEALGTSRSHMSEVLSGKRSLSLAMIKSAYSMGIPASVLLGFEVCDG